ncbi:hypothetical protein PYCC9005_001065 [Savitreella phatthalungensis]
MSSFAARNHNFLRQARSAVKVALYTIVGFSGITLTGFAGVHGFLETQSPTPGSWSRESRFAYRAALFNARYLDQPLMAREYMHRALETVYETNSQTNTSAERAATARLLILLGDLYKDAQNFEAAQEYYVAASQVALDFRHLLGAAERRHGELLEHTGDVSKARTSLLRAINLLLPPVDRTVRDSPGQLESWKDSARLSTISIPPDLPYDAELARALVSYALLTARGGGLENGLAILLSVLRYQQTRGDQHTHSSSMMSILWTLATGATARNADDDALWLPTARLVCEEASTMCNIAEVANKLGYAAEAERWMHQALRQSQDQKHKADIHCSRCAIISLNMLGISSMKHGDQETALQYMRRAMIIAEQIEDESLLQETETNIRHSQPAK